MSPPPLLAPLLATAVAPRAPHPRCSAVGSDVQSDLAAASAPASHSPASTPSSTSPPGRALFVDGQQQEGRLHSARAAARQPKQIPVPSHVRARPQEVVGMLCRRADEGKNGDKRFLC